MSRLGRSQAEKSAQALWGHSVGFKVGKGGVSWSVVLIFGERPRLGWARRKTHPSRGGHSSNPCKVLTVYPSGMGPVFICREIALLRLDLLAAKLLGIREQSESKECAIRLRAVQNILELIKTPKN